MRHRANTEQIKELASKDNGISISRPGDARRFFNFHSRFQRRSEAADTSARVRTRDRFNTLLAPARIVANQTGGVTRRLETRDSTTFAVT